MSSPPSELHDDVVSPELVLVDPALRARLRSQLVSEARSAGAVVSSAGIASFQAAVEPAECPSVGGADSGGRQKRSELVAGASIALAGAMVGIGALWLAGLVHRPGSADLVSGAPSPTAGSVGSLRLPASPRSPTVRRFSWAPVDGATSYEVAFYRGDVRVIDTVTATTSIGIAVGPKGNGRKRSLGPGRYRWYVWPIHQGRHRSAAIVDSELVVPSV